MVILSIILSIIAFPIMVSSVCLFKSIPVLEKKEPSCKLQDNEVFVLLFVAVFCITLLSRCSPLFPINPWDDANVYLTIGKSVLFGKVPYKDLVDHKGPLLYFIHTIAAMVSFDSFFGVWIIEILCLFFFLFYSYKICILFENREIKILFPILGCIIVCSKFFRLGDSAEELCLPFIMGVFFVFLQCAVDEELLSKRNCILTGLVSGILFWIKYTSISAIIGCSVWYLLSLIKKKKHEEIIRFILFFTTGFMFVTIPIIVYFSANQAVGELIDIYFIKNIFSYGENNNNVVSRLFSNMIKAWDYSPLCFSLMLCGFITSYYLSPKTKTLSLICFLSSFFFTYFGKTYSPYYSILGYIFIPFSLIFVISELRHYFTEGWKAIIPFGIIISLFGMIGICLMFTKYEFKYNRMDYPQYQFSEIINAKESPTLLEYGFLGEGFYTTTGIVPNCRYFVRLNMNSEEMIEAQKSYIEQSLVDYVVTRELNLDSNNYVLIAEGYYLNDENPYKYYLYKKKDLQN